MKVRVKNEASEEIPILNYTVNIQRVTLCQYCVIGIIKKKTKQKINNYSYTEK